MSVNLTQSALCASEPFLENVNYAVKSSFLLSFLESVPEVSAKLKEPSTQPRQFEEREHYLAEFPP